LRPGRERSADAPTAIVCAVRRLDLVEEAVAKASGHGATFAGIFAGCGVVTTLGFAVAFLIDQLA
jgi:hypothetical protein